MDSMIIDGAYDECVKCHTSSLTRINGRLICKYCGTDQVLYKKEQMRYYLLLYGFDIIKPKIQFLQRIFGKKEEEVYKYKYIIAKIINGNLKIFIENKNINNIDYCSNYTLFEKRLDKIINDKTLNRRLKLNKLKKITK